MARICDFRNGAEVELDGPMAATIQGAVDALAAIVNRIRHVGLDDRGVLRDAHGAVLVGFDNDENHYVYRHFVQRGSRRTLQGTARRRRLPISGSGTYHLSTA